MNEHVIVTDIIEFVFWVGSPWLRGELPRFENSRNVTLQVLAQRQFFRLSIVEPTVMTV